jgi:thiol-disulfide isomerase/thioredoxin
MFSRSIPLVLATLALVLCSVKPAAAHNKEEGTVAKAGEGKLILTGKGGQTHTREVAKDAPVTLDGKPAKLDDLKEGLHVVVALGEKHLVTKIEAHSKAVAHTSYAEGKTAGHKGEKQAKHDQRTHSQQSSEHKGHKAGARHHETKALEAKVKIGDNVPNFAVRTVDGKSVQLSELQKDERRAKSGVVVLSFWCSTCHSCRDVEHLLAKLSKDYEGQAAVIALGANADETGESVAAFLKESRLELPVVLDSTGNTADLFGVNVTTTTIVIDGSGVLRYCGQFRHKDGGSAEEALKAVLAGKEVAIKTTPHLGCPIMRK